jgi:hypothetical protein
LQSWLRKRRSKFYEGAALEQSIATFARVLERSTVLEYPDAIIALERTDVEGILRAWLLFDKFTRGTVRAIREMSLNFEGKAIIAETHDVRIRDLLARIGYKEFHRDATDYHLIWMKHYGL